MSILDCKLLSNLTLPKNHDTIHLNTSFTYKNFQVILRKHNFYLKDNRQKYNPNEVKQWFDFYVKNKINKSNLHLFNEMFNTNFTFDMLRSTFYNYGYRLSKVANFKNPIGIKNIQMNKFNKCFNSIWIII